MDIFILRARHFEDDEHPWWWFIGIKHEDLWLSYGMTQEADEITIAEIIDTIKGTRMTRLILFIGEPWESIANAGKATAEIQRSLMWNMSQSTYESLMAMSLDEIRVQRGTEEAQAISEELGGSGPISMN